MQFFLPFVKKGDSHFIEMHFGSFWVCRVGILAHTYFFTCNPCISLKKGNQLSYESSKRFLNSNQDPKVLIMGLGFYSGDFLNKSRLQDVLSHHSLFAFFTIPTQKLQNIINFFIKESALKGRVHNQLGLVSKKGNGSSNEQTKYISPFVQKFWGKSVNKKVKNIAFLTKKAFFYWITFL